MTTARTSPRDPAATPRGEQTREATDRKIAQATLHIAVAEGIKGVTIEKVAQWSGVAKTTIYRRYRNSEDLLKGVSFFGFSPLPDIEDLAPTRKNLALSLYKAVAYFDKAVGVKSVGLILSSDSAFFRQVFDHLVVPIRDRVAAFIENGKRAGVFRQDADANFILEQVVGGMVANAAVNGSVKPEWNQQMVDYLWLVLTTARK